MEMPAADLSAAIALACRAHAGQVDRAGKTYLLHPLRLMLRLDDTDSQIAAVLHDVVEDTDVTLQNLRQAGYSEAVVAAIDCLTRRPEESYEAFIERIAPNPLARAVKIQDLLDNMDTTRLPNFSEADATRLRRYHAALRRLQDVTA